MMPAGVGGVMAGRGYTIFDTGIGRCGIAWGHLGILGVQLPEPGERQMRARLLRRFPDATESPPPATVQSAVDGIVALLDGKTSDLSSVRN